MLTVWPGIRTWPKGWAEAVGPTTRNYSSGGRRWSRSSNRGQEFHSQGQTTTDMLPGTSATVALNVARFVRFVFALRDTCVLTQVVPPFKQTITTQSLAPFPSQETTRSGNFAPRPTHGPSRSQLDSNLTQCLWSESI